MKIRKLNALRGIAALIVVVSHYSNAVGLWGGLLGEGSGQFGVMLFFILSGFLMSYLYLDKEFNKENVKYFAIARFARVIPLFVIIVLLSYFLHLAKINGIFYAITTPKILFSHLFLLSGVSVLWTIPPEVQFYVLFAFLWWLYSRRKGYLFVLMATIFCGLVFVHFPDLQWKFHGVDIQARLVRSLPYFFIGVVFGQVYQRWQAPEYLRKNIFVLALALVPLLFPNIFHFLMGYTHTTWSDAGIFLVVSAIFFVLIFFVPDDNPILASPVGDFLGTVSYSLYLLHLPLLNLITNISKQSPLLFLFVFVALALAVAYVSYRLLEAPSRRGLRALLIGKDKPPAGEA